MNTWILRAIAFGIYGLGGLPFCYGDEAVDSPFLAQRSGDAVEWRPWSGKTVEQFRNSGKPGIIIISHELNELSASMGAESFRNPEIAGSINELFFPIAVDKSLFPAVADFFASHFWAGKQLSGWPITVFVSPQFHPMEIGGYFPPTDGWGSQGIASIVSSLSQQWQDDPGIVGIKAGESLQVTENAFGEKAAYTVPFDPEFLSIAVENIGYQYDDAHGGFGLPPRKVDFSILELLDLALFRGAGEGERVAEMRNGALQAILRGAVRDYARGGFFSASTEESWSIPDFKKEIAIQAKAIDYLSGNPENEYIVQRTASSILEDFRNGEGLVAEHIRIVPKDDPAAIAMAHTWTYEALAGALDEIGLATLAAGFGISPEGNVAEEMDVAGTFKGRNALRMRGDGPIGEESMRSALDGLKRLSDLNNEVQRERLASLRANCLAVSALWKAGPEFREDAMTLMRMIVALFWNEEKGDLKPAALSGTPVGEAAAMDYGLFVRSLLDTALYEPSFLDVAISAQREFDLRFRSDRGAYLISRKEDALLPARLLGFLETEIGSVNSIALANLRRLAEREAGFDYDSAVRAISNRLPEEVSYAPEKYPNLLLELLR